ncbi:ComF family protein [Anaerofustis sp.]|uniref:ComF family protein n=1 Tax=Anaerofustis sp. TaxID=1872517 RepID=UPI0025C3ED7F|nr:ComF family protein [Anaerofustis sp.]
MKTCYNINKLIRNVADRILYPDNPICCICKKTMLHENQIYCEKCKDKLTYTKTNKNLYNNKKSHSVYDNDINIYKGHSLWYYDKISKRIINQIKNKGFENLCIKLGQLMYEETKDMDFINDTEIIIPVPLHKDKRKIRGYNQSYLISKGFNQKANKKLKRNILIKTKPTADQKSLDKKRRQTNLTNAFEVRNKNEIFNKKILLIDDVLTTGATINLLRKILINNGASEVYFLTLATTKPLIKETR